MSWCLITSEDVNRECIIVNYKNISFKLQNFELKCDLLHSNTLHYLAYLVVPW